MERLGIEPSSRELQSRAESTRLAHVPEVGRLMSDFPYLFLLYISLPIDNINLRHSVFYNTPNSSINVNFYFKKNHK